MSDNTFSVAVGSKHGPRSCVWSISCRNEDVFISTQPRKLNRWHVTMHKSGRWHLKMDNVSVRGDPAVMKSHRHNLKQDKHEVGFWLIIPECSLVPAAYGDTSTDPDTWLERPPINGASEIAVLRWDVRGWEDENWPGKDQGTNPVRFYKQNEHLGILIAHRSLSADDPISIQAHESWKAYRDDATRRNEWIISAGESTAGAGFVFTEFNF